ncbi:dipeptidase 1-like [Chironomus tepperi]|uniref:dipeptidase 1-like n=1 Tax=Chironomus tepperi TaxID=113505 RepID=UPI00391F32F3
MDRKSSNWFKMKILIFLGFISYLNALPFAIDQQGTSLKLFKGSSILDEVPLIDSHNDLPNNLYKLENNQLGEFNLDSNLKDNPKWQLPNSFTDLPRLRAGKLGGQLWVAFVNCDTNFKDAVERTIEQIDTIKRLVNNYSNDLMYVTEADQIMEAFKAGKIASMIEIEGGHSIDSRLSALRLFYEIGVRCMTITHNCNTPWADNNLVDSNPDLPKRNLTQWGKKVIAEMNRLGMIADISHVSEGVMVDVIESSKAPVIFSHSSVYAIKNHTRNVKDHVLLKLKENNGVIMINFYSSFIGDENSTIFDVVKHINYVKDLIGVDHVGIGADYDGVSLMPEGLEDVSKYPALFDLLAEEGHDWKPWTADELKKLAGLNFIRAFKEVETVRDSLKDSETIDDPIPYNDVIAANENAGECRTDLESYKSLILNQAAKIKNDSFSC